MSSAARVWHACDCRWKSVSFYEFYASGETDKFLISERNGRREAKRSEDRRWFPTKREALDDLIERQRKLVSQSRDTLMDAAKRLALIIDTDITEEAE